MLLPEFFRLHAIAATLWPCVVLGGAILLALVVKLYAGSITG